MLRPNLSCYSPNIFLKTSAATPGPNNTAKITTYKRYSILVMRLSPARKERSMLLYLSAQTASCTASLVSVCSIIDLGLLLCQRSTSGFLRRLNQLVNLLVWFSSKITKNLVYQFSVKLYFHTLLLRRYLTSACKSHSLRRFLRNSVAFNPC